MVSQFRSISIVVPWSFHSNVILVSSQLYRNFAVVTMYDCIYHVLVKQIYKYYKSMIQIPRGYHETIIKLRRIDYVNTIRIGVSSQFISQCHRNLHDPIMKLRCRITSWCLTIVVSHYFFTTQLQLLSNICVR